MDHYATPLDWKSELWWRKRSLDERLFHLHIPKRILRLLADGAVADPVDNRKWELGDGLFIHGPSGTGKSLIAATTVMHLLTNHEISGRWVEADDYIEMLKDSFDNDGVLPEMYSSPHLIKYIKGAFDVVVLDGLGEERLTEFAVHELGSLIRKRCDKMKTTIITSRLTIGDIKHRYGERLGSVLADFEMESTRGRK